MHHTVYLLMYSVYIVSDSMHVISALYKITIRQEHLIIS